MQVVGGQLVGAGHVQPLRCAVDVQAGLVHMQPVRHVIRFLFKLLDIIGQRVTGLDQLRC